MHFYLPKCCNVKSERLQSSLVINILHVKELDSNVTVPVTSVHRAEPAAPDLVPHLEFLQWYVPLLDRHLLPTGPGAPHVTLHTRG